MAIRILSHYGVRDPDVVCAALLHDAVEDHPAELAAGRRQQAASAADGGQQAAPGDGGQRTGDGQPTVDGGQQAVDGGQQAVDGHQAVDVTPAEDGGQQAALAAVAAEFGPRVAELVAAVTNPVWRPGQDQHEQYREHVAASLEDCPWARVIKVSDFTDNGVGLIHTTGPALDRLAGKYAPLVPVLREMIARPDTPLSDQAKARIIGQLDLAAERFAAISDSSGPATPGRLSQ